MKDGMYSLRSFDATSAGFLDMMADGREQQAQIMKEVIKGYCAAKGLKCLWEDQQMRVNVEFMIPISALMKDDDGSVSFT